MKKTLSSFLFLFFSCVYDTGIPLTNNTPKCTNYKINDTVFYPRGDLCTLSISDLNDTRLYLSTLSSCDSAICDSNSDTIPWPGSYNLLNENYGEKRISLSLDTNLLGRYSGTIVVRDARRAAVFIPYKVWNIFSEPFDSCPLSTVYWKQYRANDTSTIRFDYTDKKLMFSFDNTVPPDAPHSTGIASNFTISGDFNITVDFKLRDEMTDGFETGFFVSTSPDTGKWSGDVSGLFLQGGNGRIRMECKSVDMQSYSRDFNSSSGKLGINRSGSEIKYYYYDGNPLVKPEPISSLIFSASDSVYVHMTMRTADRTRSRHVLWNDFNISSGRINFKSSHL